MKQDRLNNCLVMHCHKAITDTLYTFKIAKRFACANELRKGHFGKFEKGYALGLVTMRTPRFKTLRRLRLLLFTVIALCGENPINRNNPNGYE